MNVVILLPTYNERENIITLLDHIRSVVSDIKNHNFQILVIDDNSPDSTAELVLTYQKSHKEVKIITGKKEGLGKALVRGIYHAIDTLHADVIIQMDADLSHDPKIICQFMKRIDLGFDFVVGSRYIPGGSIPENWGLHRKIFSIVGNSIVRFGLGFPQIHDWTGGFRAYICKYASLIAPKMNKYSGYVFQIAFLHHAIIAQAKITEVPITFTDRKYGRSKIAPSEYIRNVFDYVIRERIKTLKTSSFSKFLVVGAIGLIINTVLLEVFVEIGLVPWMSNIIGAECAILSNFFFNNYWTFRQRAAKGVSIFHKLIQFNATSIIGVIIIQTGIIYIGTKIFGHESYRIWYIIGTALLVIWNYMMYSRVIWKKHS